MIVIHDCNDATLARLVSGTLAECLGVMPAVVVTGARQTGKTTLARELASGKRTYHSLDDMETGWLIRPVDYANLPPGGDITAGSTWNFQAWFRDPAAGGGCFDTSDAVSITFVP